STLVEKMPTVTRATTRRYEQQIRGELLKFLERLGTLRVLDPACGSGNFLYISMNLLKELEKEIVTFAGSIGQTLPLYQVTPDQLYGLEISPYARELAQTAIWIGYIQWHRKNGFPVQDNPILRPIDTIENVDAILDLRQPDSPKEPVWPETDVIVGNPPFLGSKLLRDRLGDDYVDALFQVYAGRVEKQSDLVCYWFEKARAMVEDGRTKRAGLLATQGIRGGANRKSLQRIKDSGDIFLAYSDRPWVLDGAAVHVSMVGFDDGSESNRILDDKNVTDIFSNLTAGIDLTKSRRLKENIRVAFMGDTKGGPFDIPEATALEMLEQTNLDGRSNREVVLRRVNGKDITSLPSRTWIIDFGVDMSIEEAALYEAPFEHVRTHVKPSRESSRSKVSRWWIHERPRVDMRQAILGLKRYIVTPTIAKHRLFTWIPIDVLPDHQLIVIARDDDYTFGVLHSRVHELWARGTGTQLREVESGFRYTPTTTFETFPFPKPSKMLGASIAKAARELNEMRESWLNPPGITKKELEKLTLTDLYNARPTWLRLAHERLDNLVLEAYGWPHDFSDEGIISAILALNLEREPVKGK
ncbi:MAG: class I SAM-dependent DNA methyltransferase, partial [Chloroflexi bacterium]|nr:class I SAM-dependent DNA methyltransferase [Chloroflexota bacterium]